MPNGLPAAIKLNRQAIDLNRQDAKSAKFRQGIFMWKQTIDTQKLLASLGGTWRPWRFSGTARKPSALPKRLRRYRSNQLNRQAIKLNRQDAKGAKFRQGIFMWKQTIDTQKLLASLGDLATWRFSAPARRLPARCHACRTSAADSEKGRTP